MSLVAIGLHFSTQAPLPPESALLILYLSYVTDWPPVLRPSFERTNRRLSLMVDVSQSPRPPAHANTLDSFSGTPEDSPIVTDEVPQSVFYPHFMVSTNSLI